ncbi:MAG TPA: DUF6241 domain-containing protein [Bacillales bacterium]|nr:DUF6241 domain-containing protein [Bacillales bacterium]
MKSKLIWTGILVVLFVGVGVVAYYSTNSLLHEVDETVGNQDNEPVVVDSSGPSQSDQMEGSSANSGKTVKHGVIQQKADWTEANIIQTLHKMTHQKVVASEKWGAVPMTLENIQTMMTVVQKRSGLDHYSLYMDMLTMWKKGHFSKADEQHNALWSLEDGTIGKATGVLSKKEEKAYINRVFGDGVKGTLKW